MRRSASTKNAIRSAPTVEIPREDALSILTVRVESPSDEGRFLQDAEGLKHVEELLQEAEGLKRVKKSYIEKDLKSLVKSEDEEKLRELGGVNAIAKLLETDLQTGIRCTEKESKDPVSKQQELELQWRRFLLGTNDFAPFSKRTLIWDSFKEAFSSDPISILNVLCSVVLIILGAADVPLDWRIGAALLVINFINLGIGMWSSYRLSEHLHRMGKNIQVQSIRFGGRWLVSASELVVGDLVELRCGDRIPADGLLVENHSLEMMRQRAGEPCSHSNFLQSGSLVHHGLGLMLVTAVGQDTESPPAHSALLRRLQSSNAFLLRLKLSISVLYILILLPFYFLGPYMIGSNPSSSYFVRGQTRAIDVIYNLVSEFNSSLSFVSIVVSDTIGVAVTLLVYFMGRMMSKTRASIWNLETCETKLGFVTTVCTGKKGVLTLNEMDVQSSWIAGTLHDGIETQSSINTLPEDIGKLLSEGVALNTTANLYSKGVDPENLENSCESPVEKALLRWGCNVGMNLDSTRKKCTTLKVEFFESERMRSGVAFQRESDGKCAVHWKGAAEIILSSCSTWVCVVGGKATTMSLSEQVRSNIKEAVQIMGESGLSCMALAYHEGAVLSEIITGDGSSAAANMLEEGSQMMNNMPLQETHLTLLAVVGIKERCRPEAKKAVKKVKDAGIRVIMVTGDSLLAARAIAKECGIIDENDNIIDATVVEASTFHDWINASDRPEKLKKLAVVARASGFDKLKLVETLQAYDRRKVVALTGHTVIDVPALKQADVGFSLSRGVEVAKESSDIILLDDSFASIYEAIKWARCMRCNIQQFLHFQVTLCFATILMPRFTTMQFQWIILITMLAAIVLTMQPPLHSLMSQTPKPPDEPLFTYPMWRNVAIQTAYQVILFGKIISFQDSPLQSTIIFNAFIFCQLINVVNARQSLLIQRKKGIFFQSMRTSLLKMLQSFVKKEMLLLGMIALIAIVQFLLITFLGSLLSTQQLTWWLWLYCLGVAFPSWFIGVLGKCLTMPQTPTVGIFST